MKKYLPLLFASFFLLTGCERTMYRLLYNSLDTIIYRTVTRYVDPGPEQERFLRDRIDLHLQWHRRDQLLKYIVTMQGIRDRMAEGVTRADIAWLRERFERHSYELYSRISDDVAAFLATLDRGQVEGMERKMAERMAEIEKKSMEDEEKRMREMERFIEQLMAFIYGPLTPRQKEQIARGVRQMENFDQERMRFYRKRQGEFIAMMKKGPGKSEIKKHLDRLFIRPELHYPEYYRTPLERQDRMIEESYIRFDGGLVTPRQRQHAIEKIDMLIRVLGELSVEKTAVRSAGKSSINSR